MTGKLLSLRGVTLVQSLSQDWADVVSLRRLNSTGHVGQPNCTGYQNSNDSLIKFLRSHTKKLLLSVGHNRDVNA